MATFTSTLPDDLLTRLAAEAKEMKLPKNKLIEKAVSIYLYQLKRARYAAAYEHSAKDQDFMSIAEEGMAEYLAQLPEE